MRISERFGVTENETTYAEYDTHNLYTIDPVPAS
jgi:hypothetical protein